MDGLGKCLLDPSEYGSCVEHGARRGHMARTEMPTSVRSRGSSTYERGVTMGIWNRVFAAGYDRFTPRSERDFFAAPPPALLAGTEGGRIEIGVGARRNTSRL